MQLICPECKNEVDLINQLEVKEGNVVECDKCGITLVINKCIIVESEKITDYSPASPTLVFDIETIGKKFEDLDKVEQDYLLNNLEKDEEEEIAKKKTGLYSIFGSVCAIGCYSPTSKRGMVLSISTQAITPEKKDFEYLIYPDEKSLLEGFWHIAKSYEKLVVALKLKQAKVFLKKKEVKEVDVEIE